MFKMQKTLFQKKETYVFKHQMNSYHASPVFSSWYLTV